MRVVVVGAGVIGASVAFHLAERGAQVTVLDGGPVAGMASGRSFGWINASYSLTDAHFHLRAAGIAAHRRLAARLPGCPTRWPGCLWYEETGSAQEDTANRLISLGYRVDRLTRPQAADMVPALGVLPETALFFPDEGAVDAAALAAALLAAPGVRLITGLAATALDTRDGGVAGVVTPLGTIPADHVVVAAGTATPQLLSPLGLPLPMLDRPGLMLTTRPLPPLLPVILATDTQELRQLPCGRLLMPAAANHQSDTATALSDSPESLADQSLARLRALFPSGKIGWERATLAQRPVPGDGLPVIGGAMPGLSVAVMHSGVTLAAVTGELLAAEVLAGAVSPLLAPFRPDRFAGT